MIDIGTRQLGLLTVEQFRLAGGSTAQLRTRRRGYLETVHPRVMRFAGSPLTWRQHLVAGLMSLGSEAVVSHEAAASLLGFDGFQEGAMVFTVKRPKRGSLRGATVHSTDRFSRIDVVQVDELLRCTSASRTIVDLAATDVSATALGNAIDSAIRDGRTSPAFLRKRLAVLRGKGVAGTPRLDEMLIDAGGHSFLERRFLKLMRDAGLPRPRTQVIHRRSTRTFARVDFEFEPQPLVVEVGGRRGHVTEADRRRDAQRRNELQADGFTVAEFLTVDVIDQPERVVATVRAHLERLSRRRPVGSLM